jgi:hypothetical protein
MEQRVVYVEASQDNPNTGEIDAICRQLAEEGLTLRSASPNLGEGGATVGLWLFFSDAPLTPPLPVAPLIGPAEVSWIAAWRDFREERKGLGASLTVTGVASVIIGVILHYALRNNIIESTLHLGYFFGIVGIFLFLIGLLLVF